MHPAFGYASVPPLIGWLAAGMQMLLGYSVFAVKLFPALLSGVFVMLAMALARELGGKTYAGLLTGVALIFMPVTLRVFHLFQPVPLDLFFWTLLFYLLIRYVHTRQDRYLLWLGAVSGLALLNKYLVVLLLLRGKSYYTIGMFPVLIAAGAVSLEKAVGNKVTLYFIPVVLVLLTLPIFPIGIPVFGQDKLVAYFKMLEDRYGMEMGRRFEDGTCPFPAPGLCRSAGLGRAHSLDLPGLPAGTRKAERAYLL